MDQAEHPPRCGRCWAPLRLDGAGEWVNDEPLSGPVCMRNGPHEPMDDVTLKLWHRVNRPGSVR
jgi:hypothetical protein